MQYKNFRRSHKKWIDLKKIFITIFVAIFIIATIALIIFSVKENEKNELAKAAAERKTVDNTKEFISDIFKQYREDEIIWVTFENRIRDLDKNHITNIKYRDEFHTLLFDEIRNLDFEKMCIAIKEVDKNLFNIKEDEIIDDVINKFNGTDVKSLDTLPFYSLEEIGICNSNLMTLLQEKINDTNLTVAEKLELGVELRGFDRLDYYTSRVSIKIYDLKSYIEENGEAIYTEKGKGGYYDGKQDRFVKTSKLEYDYTKTSYFGDFCVQEISEEYLDEYYQRRQRVTLKMYFRGIFLQDVNPKYSANFQCVGDYLIRNYTDVYYSGLKANIIIIN